MLEQLPRVASGDWFMDYRNADGSVAEMCGNGVRVFAHYLRAAGLESADEFVVGSLAGPRPVIVHHADDVHAEVTVDMGKPNLLGSSGPAFEALVGGGASRAWASTSATRTWPVWIRDCPRPIWPPLMSVRR